MDILFIVNPNAGGKRAAKVWSKLSERAMELFPGAEVVFTKGKDHAEVIATKNPHKCLIVVGGDGTFHEALQGSVSGDCKMGILPAGSGNDLARSLGLPEDPAKALEVLGKKQLKTIDLGKIGHEYFVNGAGIGYDAKVTDDVNHRSGLIQGKLAYLIAVFKNLFFYPGLTVDIQYDEKTERKNILCLTAGNGPFLGGGIPVVPEADNADGLLSFSIIENIGFLKRLQYLRKVLAGKHGDEEFVTMLDRTTLSVSSKDDMLYHQDGEVFRGKSVVFEICPKKLHILA
ncbi:diacylglycerol kinase family lipid kinase [Clostridia bacterium]|nr:diacylglycerol kinase family lipid kinase [Clostridia bacterium]